MYSAGINLVLYYAGLGFALFLVWGILAFDAAKADRPRWAKAAATALAVVGIAHPAAALGAWDLRRHLAVRSEAPARPTAASLLPVLGSVAIAVAATLLLA